MFHGLGSNCSSFSSSLPPRIVLSFFSFLQLDLTWTINYARTHLTLDNQDSRYTTPFLSQTVVSLNATSPLPKGSWGDVVKTF
ncbi:hypothetical protein CKA32_001365 [Geitlerinema sp. FC II]|nr:hypothetical protein CKA32_001365 [Geitlerinema sp. FC II]